MSKTKEVLSSKREANRVLWDNDSPFKQKIVPDKNKQYSRKEKHKKDYKGPFSLASSTWVFCPLSKSVIFPTS